MQNYTLTWQQLFVNVNAVEDDEDEAAEMSLSPLLLIALCVNQDVLIYFSNFLNINKVDICRLLIWCLLMSMLVDDDDEDEAAEMSLSLLLLIALCVNWDVPIYFFFILNINKVDITRL